MGQKLSVTDIEQIFKDEFHPTTAVCATTSSTSNCEYDYPVKTSTVFCWLHKDCLEALDSGTADLKSHYLNSIPKPHTHFSFEADFNIYDGQEIAVKVIPKKNSLSQSKPFIPNIFVPSNQNTKKKYKFKKLYNFEENLEIDFQDDLNNEFLLSSYIREISQLGSPYVMSMKGPRSGSAPPSPAPRHGAALHLTLSAPDTFHSTEDTNNGSLKTLEMNVSQAISCVDLNEVDGYYTIKKEFFTEIASIFRNHSNLSTIIDIIETPSSFLILSEKKPFNLDDALKLNLQSNSDVSKLFLFYQIIDAIQYCHDNGIVHGNLEPSKVILSDNQLWIYLCGFLCPSTIEEPSFPPKYMNDLSSVVEKWVQGEISNFDYLMYLNTLSGRRVNNVNFHPIMPWVIDFRESNGGWRDLTKSKFRLTKGDEQLDITYTSSDNKYHITEPLSDLTYYHYFARRTPISLLRKYVRPNYEPNEYPSNMQRMYEWTPDECIPEFYSDPTIFRSIHSDMPDIQIPEWATSPADFILKHRAALESDYVSDNLNNWIDLMFGYKLSGPSGVEAKNIAMIQNDVNHRNQGGFVQLFSKPHPRRSQANNKNMGNIYYQEVDVVKSMNNLSDHENLQNFIAHCENLSPVYRAPRVTSDVTMATKFDILKSNDIFSLGCILAELFLDCPLFTSRTLGLYLSHNQLPSNLYKLPVTIRSAVISMIQLDSLSRPSALDLLRSSLFPHYFNEMYSFLSSFHKIKNLNQRLTLTMENISKLLSIPDEGFELVLPFILGFFSENVELELRKEAALSLFDPLGAKLGPLKSKKYLLSPISKFYNIQNYDQVLTTLLDLKFVSVVLNRLGEGCFIDSILPNFLDALRSNDEKIVTLISSLLPEVPSLIGNFLTVKYMVYPLLAQLTKNNTDRIVANLIDVGRQLGEEAIIHTYVPFLFNMLQRHSSKQSRGEESLIASLEMFGGLVDVLSPSTVLNTLVLQTNYLFVLLLNPTSPRIMKTLARTLILISSRIGPSATHKSVLPYLRQFFSHYNEFYVENSVGNIVYRETSNEGLREIYSPKMAYLLYDQFKPLVGQDVLREDVSNHALIELMVKKYTVTKRVEGKQVKSYKANFANTTDSYKAKVDSEIETCSWMYASITDEPPRNWSFSNTMIHIYKGHSSSVRCMDVLANESCFVTGGKDNSVKLWVLDNPSLNVSYFDHTSAINDVHFINNGKLVASCSSNSLHVWDVEKRHRLFQFDADSNICSFEPIRNDKAIISINSESVVSFLDLGSGKMAYEWLLPSAGSSNVKCLTSSENWIAAGSSLGDITVIDQRSGCIIDNWRAHESAILKIAQYGSDYLVVSSADKTISVWNIATSNAVLVKRIRGHTEPVDTFAIYRNQLVSCGGNKLGFVDLNNEIQQFRELGANGIHSSLRLQTTKFGIPSVKTLSIMSYRQMALMGGDDGNIRVAY